MNMNTLIANISNKIINSSEINNWTISNYGSMITVYTGIDERSLPPESAYPLAHIYPLSKSVGMSLEENEHVIAITCGIVDSSSSTDLVSIAGFQNPVKKIIYAGVTRIEEFRKLIETEVLDADVESMFFQTLDIQYEVVESFPFFLCNMTFSIGKQYSQGEDTWA